MSNGAFTRGVTAGRQTGPSGAGGFMGQLLSSIVKVEERRRVEDELRKKEDRSLVDTIKKLTVRENLERETMREKEKLGRETQVGAEKRFFDMFTKPAVSHTGRPMGVGRGGEISEIPSGVVTTPSSGATATQADVLKASGLRPTLGVGGGIGIEGIPRGTTAKEKTDIFAEWEKELTSEYTIGAVYEDAQGNRKRYKGEDAQGNPIWEDM